MSVVNQMLRELDARDRSGTAQATFAPVAEQPTRKRASLGIAAGLILLVAVGAGYWVTRPAPHPAAADARPEVPADRTPTLAPVALPAVEAVQDRTPAAPTEAAPVRNMPAAPLAPAAELARLVQPPPAVVPLRPMPEASPGTQTSISQALVNAPEIEAQRLIDDAAAERRAGNIEAALALYRQALAKAPTMSQTRLALAAFLRDMRRDSEAMEVLENGYALRAQPALAVAAGRLLADQGRREEALDWLVRGYKSARPVDFALMGALYAHAQRHEEAVAAYRRALAADTSQAGWLLGLGLSLEALGRRDEARGAYRAALERGAFEPEVETFLRDRSR